jgi:hypothetical protein
MYDKSISFSVHGSIGGFMDLYGFYLPWCVKAEREKREREEYV